MDKPKMLIAEDSLLKRRVLVGLFDQDYEVIQASDGIEALALLRENCEPASPENSSLASRNNCEPASPENDGPIAVVLLDIIMPKIDGLDVLREMRADARLNSIPVIVTSAAGDELYRQKALELGAVDYIASPFNPLLVKLQVRSVLATKEYDRLRLQNELLSLKSREDAGYRAVLEDTHTAILEFDGAGHIIRYDAVIKKELAGTYDERQLADIFLQDGVAEPEAVDALRCLFERILADKAAVSKEMDMLLRRPSGDFSWFQLRLLKKVDGLTGEAKLVMSISNIDEQKREEEATRTQLLHALSDADNANRAKGEFMSRMSHEIRTPLNAILGFVNLAKECLSEPDRVREYLTKTEFASRHLLGIINDVLDMSAIESGKMQLARETCQLPELISAATAIINPLAAQKDISFEVQTNGLPPTGVIGDPMRLSQIMINLLSNAVKFTPQGGRVILEACAQAKDRDARTIELQLIVRDTGIGMTPEFIERLGQSYEQQDATVARKYGGSGLGLAITKNIIAMMQGTLAVTSLQNCGSTFTVTLPLELAPTECAEPSARVQTEKISGKRVLLAEDNPMNMEIASRLLEKFGLKVTAVTNGLEALQTFSASTVGEFNIILMDIQMPEMDGYTATEKIRDCGRRDAAEIPIIAMTASAFVQDVQDALACGMNGHIAKPFDIAELRQIIGQYIL